MENCSFLLSRASFQRFSVGQHENEIMFFKTSKKNMFEGYEARDDYIDQLIRDKKASLEENHSVSDVGLRVHYCTFIITYITGCNLQPSLL